MGKEGVLLVNTRETSEEVRAKLLNKKLAVYVIDATGIAKELLGKNLPNTVMAGAIAKFVSSIDYKGLSKKMVEKLGAKLAKEVVDKNLEALEKGYAISAA
jgi:Pyruvate/2-oxoacid:ferredoxin oxidoreductase gamma subunit